MPISEARAEILTHEHLQGTPNSQIADLAHYKDSPHKRQQVYKALRNPLVKAKIAEKITKIFSVDELQQINSRRIKQLDDTFKKRKKLTSKDAKLLSVEDSIIQTAGKFQSAFIQKSVNLTVVAQLQADQSKPLSTQQLIDAITNTIRQPEQGRGEANMGDKV